MHPDLCVYTEAAPSTPVYQIFALILTKEMTKGLNQVIARLSIATPVVLTLEIFYHFDIDVRDAQPITEWLKKQQPS